MPAGMHGDITFKVHKSYYITYNRGMCSMCTDVTSVLFVFNHYGWSDYKMQMIGYTYDTHIKCALLGTATVHKS